VVDDSQVAAEFRLGSLAAGGLKKSGKKGRRAERKREERKEREKIEDETFLKGISFPLSK
jgi:hypothetical protein